MRAKTSSRVLVAVDADSNKVALSVENALIFTEDPDFPVPSTSRSHDQDSAHNFHTGRDFGKAEPDLDYPKVKVKQEPKTKTRRRPKKSRQRNLNFKRYIGKVLKGVHPNASISKKAMSVMNDFCRHNLGCLFEEAIKMTRFGKRLTLQPKDIQAAVTQLMTPRLAHHARNWAHNAMINFKKSYD